MVFEGRGPVTAPQGMSAIHQGLPILRVPEANMKKVEGGEGPSLDDPDLLIFGRTGWRSRSMVEGGGGRGHR